MHLIMFDIDGTLIQSNDFDTECFALAVNDVLEIEIDTDWSAYSHATDAGIISEIIDRNPQDDGREEVFNKIKAAFIARIKHHIATYPVFPVKGAPEFISTLRKLKHVRIAIATGGFRETAEMKLASAGIDYTGIPIASSDEDFRRTEIMKIAEKKCGSGPYDSRTYFGDAVWDKLATKALGFNFVLIGNHIEHDLSVPDYSSANHVLKILGL